jgi:hypothetical protein
MDIEQKRQRLFGLLGTQSIDEPQAGGLLGPATMNPNLEKQGRIARALMAPPTSVMDERYPAWKKSQDQADQFLIASDFALALAPLASSVFRGGILSNLAAPSPINTASRGQAGMIKTPFGRIPETRSEQIKLIESLRGRAKAAGYDVSEDVAQTGTRYVNVTSADGTKTAKIRFGDHDANMRRMAGGESFSVDPGTGGTYEEAIKYLEQSGLPVASRAKPVPRKPTMLETTRMLREQGMSGPDAFTEAVKMLHRGEIID